MTINLFQSPEYKALMTEHITNTINYLFDRNQGFAIACPVEHVTFDPVLPESLMENFNDTALFILSGYTFESATLDKKDLHFEAGFGKDDFASFVSIPILAIEQVVMDGYPIVLNLAKHTPIKKMTVESSMESLLNNPKNKNLLKKRK